MRTVTSKDGTTIAFDQSGKGPALILVGGAFEQRAMDSETSQLAAFPLLAQHFTVFHYDRRGRGDSTDTQPYAVEREIEDIEALIDAAGGSAFVSGISSGAALAMEAAIALPGKIKGLAMYEPPYNSDEPARHAWKAYRRQLEVLLAEGRRGDAVGLFMTSLGMPADQLEGMRQHPLWPMWEAVAPTLAYDAAVLGEEASVPTERAARVAVPTLIMDGSASYPFMHITATALADTIPNAQHRTLEGQPHEVAAEAIAPVLVEFFKG
ncbi:MAG: alpha/beta hydrolase [Chloroflexota bacterium]|nr:alpha/beta hydrolase [Chloroflexota bacterium]